MRVELSRGEGRPGDLVTVRVTTEDPSRVTGVRLTVGGDLELNLQRNGDAWTGAQSVPWDAPEGTYDLSIRAYDAGWRAVESADVTFHVQA